MLGKILPGGRDQEIKVRMEPQDLSDEDGSEGNYDFPLQAAGRRADYLQIIRPSEADYYLWLWG